jgi:hypothetical protein
MTPATFPATLKAKRIAAYDAIAPYLSAQHQALDIIMALVHEKPDIASKIAQDAVNGMSDHEVDAVTDYMDACADFAAKPLN